MTDHFSRQIFEKSSNIMLLKSVQWEPRFPCGLTDRRDEANSRYSQFRERT